MWDTTSIFFANGSVNPNRLHKEFGPPSPESDAAWAKLIQCKYCSADFWTWVEVLIEPIQTKIFVSKKRSLENIAINRV